MTQILPITQIRKRLPPADQEESVQIISLLGLDYLMSLCSKLVPGREL